MNWLKYNRHKTTESTCSKQKNLILANITIQRGQERPITFFSAFKNVIGQRRLRCSLKVYTVILVLYSLNVQCCNAQPTTEYYNWTRPLTLRLVRRLHRGVRRRHQRIAQLAHSLVTSYPTTWCTISAGRRPFTAMTRVDWNFITA